MGTDRGRVSQLRLTAQMSDTGLNYYTDVVQTLQLAQVHGTSHVTAATPATLDPVATQPQLNTPFAQKPRLTLSSSASSYHGSDAAVELALSNECQLPQPAAVSASARAALEESNPGREASSPLFSAAGQTPRQLPTVQSELGDLAPMLTAAHGSQGSPVQAVAVVGGRVVISMQAKACASLQEWSLDGELLKSHACNDLGENTTSSPLL